MYTWAWAYNIGDEKPAIYRLWLAGWLTFRYALRDPITLCTIAHEMRWEDTGDPTLDGVYDTLANACEEEAERRHKGIVRKMWTIGERVRQGEDSMALIVELRQEVGVPP